MKGISMPWNRAIFVAMAADSLGSRRSRVFSGRLCTQEPLRVVRGLGQEGVGMGQWGRSGSRGQGPEGRHREGTGGWGRRCLVLGCTAPAGPLERLRRAGAPATAPQGWRTSHFQGPRSPRPGARWTARGGSRTASGWAARRVCVPLPARRKLQPTTRRPASSALSLGGAVPPARPRGQPSLRPHLQDGPVQPQQHLPRLLADAGQVVRQRAAEEQVAEAPAADHTGVSAAAGSPPGPSSLPRTQRRRNRGASSDPEPAPAPARHWQGLTPDLPPHGVNPQLVRPHPAPRPAQVLPAPLVGSALGVSRLR